jgi:hypothetical protein
MILAKHFFSEPNSKMAKNTPILKIFIPEPAKPFNTFYLPKLYIFNTEFSLPKNNIFNTQAEKPFQTFT